MIVTLKVEFTLNTDFKDIYRIDRAILCNRKGQNESFMMCPVCEFFPCSQLTEEDLSELHQSPLMDRDVVKFKPRRCKLFIIKYLDGSLKEAPELDPANPDKVLMQNVDTVYQIGRELVPVIVLKPKPKGERKNIKPKSAEKARKQTRN